MKHLIITIILALVASAGIAQTEPLTVETFSDSGHLYSLPLIISSENGKTFKIYGDTITIIKSLLKDREDISFFN